MDIAHVVNWVDWDIGWRRSIAELVVEGFRSAQAHSSPASIICQIACLTDCPPECVPEVFNYAQQMDRDSSSAIKQSDRKLPFLHDVMKAGRHFEWIIFSNADTIPAPGLYRQIEQADEAGRESVLYRAQRLEAADVDELGDEPEEVYDGLEDLPFAIEPMGLEAFAICSRAWDRIRGRVAPYLLGECRWDDAVRYVLLAATACHVDRTGQIYHIDHPSKWSANTPEGTYNDIFWNYQLSKDVQYVRELPETEL